MVLKKFIYLLILFGLTSCWGFAKLSIEKKDIRNSNIHIDGFYWGDSEYQGFIDIYIFYENGTMFLFGSENKEEFDLAIVGQQMQNAGSTDYISSQGSWGQYEIQNDFIQFEYWSTKEKRPSKFKTKLWKGKILSDTTFMIDSVLNNYQKKTYYPNSKYHFYQFSPKPDSTNNFIK